uniref:Uncharacterized protein n=1 Tax=Arundo donax TaxID=35708 RepID=A0A0A9CBQ3_ARUDO
MSLSCFQMHYFDSYTGNSRHFTVIKPKNKQNPEYVLIVMILKP